MRRRLLAFAVTVLVTPASAGETSRAVLRAIETGEIIGAASACGLPEADLAVAGRKALAQVRGLTTDKAVLARARSQHETAIKRGFERGEAAGEEACDAAVTRFRSL